MTPAEFIDEKGGPAEMTRTINENCPATERVDSGAIALWRHRNKIPRGNWPAIIDAYPDTTLQQLREIEAAGRAAKSGEGLEERPAA
jgi:hypothetical protein